MSQQLWNTIVHMYFKVHTYVSKLVHTLYVLHVLKYLCMYTVLNGIRTIEYEVCSCLLNHCSCAHWASLSHHTGWLHGEGPPHSAWLDAANIQASPLLYPAGSCSGKQTYHCPMLWITLCLPLVSLCLWYVVRCPPWGLLLSTRWNKELYDHRPLVVLIFIWTVLSTS